MGEAKRKRLQLKEGQLGNIAISRKRQEKIEAGRLAFREEGEFWNVYFAKADDEDDRIHLGSIRMNAIDGTLPGGEDRRIQFTAIMENLVSSIFKQLGHNPEWTGPQKAKKDGRN